MNRATQRKGDIAVTQAIATFTRLGYDVSVPLTESAKYDLIVDDGAGLHRVQCKYTSKSDVDLRCIHSNSTGYVIKSYDETSFDWLYAYNPDKGEFLLRNLYSFRSAALSKMEKL